MTSTVRRSWLIVPAHNQRALVEAAASEADVVVLDLQDTVHDSRKHEARANVRDAIGTMRDAGAEVFVRPDVEVDVRGPRRVRVARTVGSRASGRYECRRGPGGR